MQKTMFWFVSLLFFCSDQAMNKKPLWVETIDKKKRLIDSNIIDSSNLLTVLQEKYIGSYTNPLIIPFNKTLLQFYCFFSVISAKTLYKTLSISSYYQLIDAVEKFKALKMYINLVTEILPTENEAQIQMKCSHGHITQKWIGDLLIGPTIKKEHKLYTFPTKKNYNRKSESHIIISNNGNYLIHNFCDQSEPSSIELYHTKTKEIEYLHPSRDAQCIYCSPNNNYILIVDQFLGIHLYHIPTKEKFFLYHPYNQQSEIIISDNSKYILNQQILPFNDYITLYKLWHINDNNTLEEIDLNNNLSASKSAIFHHDNEHIFHLNEGNLYLYNISTKTNTKLDPKGIRNHPKHFIFFDKLVMSSDKKHIICKIKNPRNTSLSDHFNYIVLHIQNIAKTIFTTLPPSYLDYLPPLCIPHTNLIAHCVDNKNLLQLLNEKQKIVASHTRKNSRISQMATDESGNHLACGYCDGTIIMWNISNLYNQTLSIGTKLVGLNMPIKNLVFTSNHLLFSCSRSQLFSLFQNTGQAILWDLQGKKIIDFGNTVLDANINKKGSVITIVKSEYEENNMQRRNTVRNLTLTCCQINQLLPAPTLKQAYTFLYPEAEAKKGS